MQEYDNLDKGLEDHLMVLCKDLYKFYDERLVELVYNNLGIDSRQPSGLPFSSDSRTALRDTPYIQKRDSSYTYSFSRLDLRLVFGTAPPPPIDENEE